MLIHLLAGFLWFAAGAIYGKSPPVSQPIAGEEEVGAVGAELRYWRANEAVRQGEMLLRLQATTRSSIISQATTMLGWVVTAATASVGIAIGSTREEWRDASIAIAIGLGITAFICVYIVFPRNMSNETFEPYQILDSKLPSELEILESMAEGHSQGIDNNKKRLISLRFALILAWLLFALSPVAGGAILEAMVFGFPTWVLEHLWAAEKALSK
jgi:hypothetical protein